VKNTSTSRFDSLGDRMKMYENIECGRILIPHLPIMARLDGRSFHNFTRGLDRPYDEHFAKCMIETAKYLVEQTHCNFAYTQSDEITIGFWNETIGAESFFNGRIQKLVSTLASLATVKFNNEVIQHLPHKKHLLPTFDARVFNLPNLEEMSNCVLFRALDCDKNAVTMAASSYFSHAQLHKVYTAQKIEMLRGVGIQWEDYPDFFKQGTFVRKELIERTLSEEELGRIPENKRPVGPVIRSIIVEVKSPRFVKIDNKIGFLFNRETPQLIQEMDDNG
jgi:tRNA(His) 5'-end guanylyltransferase